MMCLYCGSDSTAGLPGLHVCRCGRSGHWAAEFRVELIDCEPQFQTPDWLRALRRWYYSIWPANGPILDAARRTENRTEITCTN